MRALLPAAIAFLAAGCPAGLEAQTHVSKLRVLGIKADPRILEFAAAAQLDGGAFDAGGLIATLDQGVPLLIGFTASTAIATFPGFATLTLRTAARGPANTNPRLVDLQMPEVHTGETIRLQPITAPKDDPAEHYLFSFFATDGSMAWLHSTDLTSTGESAPTWVEWTAPKAVGQIVHFWVVLRDGRGGIDWIDGGVQVK